MTQCDFAPDSHPLPAMSPGRRRVHAMLDANKTDFITLILDQLNEHSVRDSAMLYESPFTDRISRGPDGLFSSAQADQLLTAIAP